MMDRVSLAVERAWYRAPRLLLLLLPLEWLFALVTAARRYAFRHGWLASHHPGVPVVVIGNISVGGTGKTPVVIALAQALTDLGISVGVVSRGYGGAVSGTLVVTEDSDSKQVGDEALLIAQSCAARVVVGRDRVAAAAKAAEAGVDVVLTDDGLQHYRLQRDVEVVTMDATTGFGNGHLLPVGPLRESPRRLAIVDFVLQRGGQDPHSGTAYIPRSFRRLGEGEVRDAAQPGFGRKVHAIAAIARPQRFFDTLRSLGLEPVEHCFPDHRPFESRDFDGLDDLPIVMTAKDAVKCPQLPSLDAWVLDMQLRLPENFVQQLLARAGLSEKVNTTGVESGALATSGGCA